jgi:hypothetical protein
VNDRVKSARASRCLCKCELKWFARFRRGERPSGGGVVKQRVEQPHDARNPRQDAAARTGCQDGSQVSHITSTSLQRRAIGSDGSKSVILHFDQPANQPFWPSLRHLAELSMVGFMLDCDRSTCGRKQEAQAETHCASSAAHSCLGHADPQLLLRRHDHLICSPGAHAYCADGRYWHSWLRGSSGSAMLLYALLTDVAGAEAGCRA